MVGGASNVSAVAGMVVTVVSLVLQIPLLAYKAGD